VSELYEGQQYVGIDLHRRRSVMVRMTAAGEHLETLHLDNDPLELGLALRRAGEDPQVVLEATYGWYWAADVLADAGAQVHLAHPLGIKGFANRRVKNDERDAADLADLLRMNRLPESWIPPAATQRPDPGNGLDRLIAAVILQPGLDQPFEPVDVVVQHADQLPGGLHPLREPVIERQRLEHPLPAIAEQVTHRHRDTLLGQHRVHLTLQPGAQRHQLGPMPDELAQLPASAREEPGGT
jgi:transposase